MLRDYLITIIMLLAITLPEFENDKIIFCDPIKNTVIDNSKFIRLIYSPQNYTLNGLFVVIPFLDYRLENNFNRYKCYLNPEKNGAIIKNIMTIEQQILDKYNLPKTKIYKLRENIKNGVIKVFNENNSFKNFILKISGLWENQHEYGLTYKFITI